MCNRVSKVLGGRKVSHCGIPRDKETNENNKDAVPINHGDDGDNNASWSTLCVCWGAARDTETTNDDYNEGASIATSVFNVSNGGAGSGILTLAAAKATGTGWIPSILICLALAAVNSHTFSLVGMSCEMTGCDSFKDLWAYAFGGAQVNNSDKTSVIRGAIHETIDNERDYSDSIIDKTTEKSTDDTTERNTKSSNTAWVVDAMVFFQTILGSIIYIGIMGDVLFSFLSGALGIDTWWSSRTSVIVLVALSVLYPLCLIPNLRALRFTSILGLVAVLYTVVFSVMRALDGTYRIGDYAEGGFEPGKFVGEGSLPHMPSFEGSSLWNADMYSLVLISNLSQSFICHYNAPSYWKSMGKSASSQKFTNVSRLSYLILGVNYAVIMCAGYATFGDVSMGNILLNYASADVLATLGQLATGFSVLFGYPLLANGCREGFKNATEALGWGAPSDPRFRKILVLAQIAGPAMLSIVAEDIGLVAGLSGAVMGSSLAYVCPALLYVKIVGRKMGIDSEEYRRARWNLVLIPFGCFTASMGVVMTIQNAIFSS
mmetsp:Transcript_16828/g.38632  ORF Transcript_16828/g.38632 Transcript_16828/m.38632 type:complete len:546 (-) Transcript_16828:559-2196(-)